MRKVLPGAVLFIILLLPLVRGCKVASVQKEADEEGIIRIYRMDMNETQLLSENYKLKSVDIEDRIRELLSEIEKTPETPSYKKAKPDDVVVKDFYFGEDSQLILDFSAEYSGLGVIQEILCRAAVVKTLCQLEGIDYVEFYVNGQPLVLTGELPIGQMQSTDFIDNTGEEAKFTQKTGMTLYFPTKQGNILSESIQTVESDGSRTLEKMIIEQLIRGPLLEQWELSPVIPEGTVLNSIATKDGICYVDFNESFLNKPENLTEEVIIYSVVNSLVELPHISKVQFTINGEIRRVYSELDMSGLFERRPDLILNEKAGDAN